MALKGNAVKEVTSGSPNTISVAGTSTSVIGANENRNGLEIVNSSSSNIWLGLGKAAKANEGIYLSPSGSWDGKIGLVAWDGEVTAIATTASSPLTVIEV